MSINMHSGVSRDSATGLYVAVLVSCDPAHQPDFLTCSFITEEDASAFLLDFLHTLQAGRFDPHAVLT